MAKPGTLCRYKSAEELEAAVREYTESCGYTVAKTSDGTIVMDANGKPVFTKKIPTIAGLAYHLGYASRQSIYDLEKNRKFSYAIKRARLAIESYIESELIEGKATGPIFWLKNNAGYKDSQEFTGGNGAPLFPSKIVVQIVRPTDAG